MVSKIFNKMIGRSTHICESVSDDFAKKFMEWKDKEYLESRIGLMDRGFAIYMPIKGDPKEVTTEDLIKIFKDNFYE
jgi:hypothetical protein